MWFSATVFLGLFSRTRPKGPISNASGIRLGRQYVKSETFLDLKGLTKDSNRAYGPRVALRVKHVIYIGQGSTGIPPGSNNREQQCYHSTMSWK